jgi:uncharacterized protein YgfB (UPF0149 family)
MIGALRVPQALTVTTRFANSTLDYERLDAELAGAGAVVALAELHGGVCAALCAGGAAKAERWLEEALADRNLEGPLVDVASVSQELVDASWQMLSQGELTFEPLVPSSEAPLDERVQALAVWCHGFLAGLGATAPDIGHGAGDEDLREILGDFAEISRAGVSGEEAEGELEADFSLAEIHEHVRVSVQIVFEQLAPYRAAAAHDVH